MRAWPTACRAGPTGPEQNRTIWLSTLGRGEDIADPDIRAVVTGLVRRAVALLAARHVDDTQRLRYALECWTGLNRSATRRWLQGQATREQTHELIASTLEHVLRTFGTPPKPNRRTPLPEMKAVESRRSYLAREPTLAIAIPESGRTSGLGPRVTCFSPLPLRFIVQMWGGVIVVACTNAMRLPLGDQTGSNEKPFFGSLRTRFRPRPSGRTV